MISRKDRTVSDTPTLVERLRTWRTERGPIDWNAADRLILESADRIAELEAVAERLPRTADGVPVVPGMIVWIHERGSSKIGTPWQTLTEQVVTGMTEGCVEVESRLRLFEAAACCYSTREAAEAAGEE